ncbi:MAG: hypothetical protein M1818_003483 [Claussenomyces sp. TS43310]|nr:MAG: hypothetical protein M1818_003483 [Claussenomyces sp. TS43310]
MIQAGLLLVVYECIHGRLDVAFVTIAGSARMAYVARIHTRDRHQTHITHTAGQIANTDLLLQAEEAANAWWGIVIYERRTFFSELKFFDRPLRTVFPGLDARLPIEPQVLDQLDTLGLESLPDIPVSCLTSLKAIFTSHWHILGQHPQVVRAQLKPLEDWSKRSQEALDTVMKMVVDIAESLIAASLANTATKIDAMPPMYPYIARTALRYIHSTPREDVDWPRNVEDVL